jgi:hypothetical protein
MANPTLFQRRTLMFGPPVETSAPRNDPYVPGGTTSRQEVKKKVTMDLLFSPFSLAPFVLGATALVAGWANDGPLLLFLSGAGAMLAGTGLLATRFLLQLDSLVEKAYKALEEDKERKKKQEIMDLHTQLLSDHDKYGEFKQNEASTALNDLVGIYSVFHKTVGRDDLSIPTKSVLVEQVDDLYAACYKRLQNTHELWKESRNVSGKQRIALRQQRDREIKEVLESIDQITQINQQCLDLSKQSRDDLSDLRRELDNSMAVAKRTVERMGEMGLGRVDEKI